MRNPTRWTWGLVSALTPGFSLSWKLMRNKTNLCVTSFLFDFTSPVHLIWEVKWNRTCKNTRIDIGRNWNVSKDGQTLVHVIEKRTASQTLWVFIQHFVRSKSAIYNVYVSCLCARILCWWCTISKSWNFEHVPCDSEHAKEIRNPHSIGILDLAFHTIGAVSWHNVWEKTVCNLNF